MINLNNKTSNGVKKILATILMMMSLGIPVFVFAADVSLGGTPLSVSGGITNPLKSDFDTFPKFAAQVTKTAVEILMPFVVLAFMYSGYLFVKAQGNAAGIEEAKTAIWYSIIGAFILMGAWGFATIIGDTVSTLTTP